MSQTHQLEDLPLDIDYDEEPTTPSQDRAEEHLRFVAYWRNQRGEIEAHAKAQQDRIALWLEREQERIDRKIAWHEEALQGFLWQSGKKSVRLIHGSVRRIKGRERIEIIDEETFLSAAPPVLIRQQIIRQPDKKAILAHVQQSGEIPTGVDVIRGEDRIHIEAEE